MARMSFRGGPELDVVRTGRFWPTDYELEVWLKDGEKTYTASSDLSVLVDASIDGRSDVTVEVIEQGVEALLDGLDDDGLGDAEVVRVSVEECHKIRRTETDGS